MKAEYNAEPGTEWHLGDGPYRFSGPPQECLGTLILANTTDHKVKIRRLPTGTPGRVRKGNQALESTHIEISARLPPLTEIRSAARLELPPDTPPGLYQGTLLCGPRKIGIEAEVQAHRELMVEPSHMRLHGTSGDEQQYRLLFSNLGNVPVPLDNVAMVWLREKDWIGRSLVYTLRETQPEETYEDFANRLLHEFCGSMIRPASVHLEPDQNGPLLPGQQREMILKLTLPSGLKKGRTYNGFLKICDDRIWMELYCNGGLVSSKHR